MNKERLRKDVYEMVWAKLTQQLKMHIAIEEDPEDDKLDDIEALISVSNTMALSLGYYHAKDKNYKSMHLIMETLP